VINHTTAVGAATATKERTYANTMVTCNGHVLPQDTHIGILKHLHWLPTEQRIKFKLATLLPHSHCPTPSLRSANANLLSVSRVHTTFASRGFSVAALAVWNSLPSDLRDSSSTHTFRRLLKTHCFLQAFGSP